MSKRREMRQERLENSTVFLVQINDGRQLHYLAARRRIQWKLGAYIGYFRRLLKHFIEGEAVMRQQRSLEAHMNRPALVLIDRRRQ